MSFGPKEYLDWENSPRFLIAHSPLFLARAAHEENKLSKRRIQRLLMVLDDDKYKFVITAQHTLKLMTGYV